jgi:hypothetical protein
MHERHDSRRDGGRYGEQLRDVRSDAGHGERHVAAVRAVSTGITVSGGVNVGPKCADPAASVSGRE